MRGVFCLLFLSGCAIHVHADGDLAAALGLVVVGAAMAESESAADPRPEAPPLTPARRVNEQDCAKPIEDPYANLRCR